MKMRFYIHTLSIAACMWISSAVAAQEPPDTDPAPDPNIEQCRRDLDDCVIAAQVPADIEVCSAREARCIAGEMHVPVPDDVPVDSLIKCTYTAAECTLKALNADSLSSCTWALEQCIDAALHAQFSCIDKFTQCVADDPLLLPICSLELLVCTE